MFLLLNLKREKFQEHSSRENIFLIENQSKCTNLSKISISCICIAKKYNKILQKKFETNEIGWAHSSPKYHRRVEPTEGGSAWNLKKKKTPLCVIPITFMLNCWPKKKKRKTELTHQYFSLCILRVERVKFTNDFLISCTRQLFRANDSGTFITSTVKYSNHRRKETHLGNYLIC